MYTLWNRIQLLSDLKAHFSSSDCHVSCGGMENWTHAGAEGTTEMEHWLMQQGETRRATAFSETQTNQGSHTAVYRIQMG